MFHVLVSSKISYFTEGLVVGGLGLIWFGLGKKGLGEELNQSG